MRWLGVLLALLCLATGCGADEHQSPLRVTLWAENHHPHPSQSPSWHWWYCVKVTTPGASRILVQIVSGRTRVEGVGEIWLKKGYNRWCADIGGEANVLDALPRGKKLVLLAAVWANGVTVERKWPIVVPVGHASKDLAFLASHYAEFRIDWGDRDVLKLDTGSASLAEMAASVVNWVTLRHV